MKTLGKWMLAGVATAALGALAAHAGGFWTNGVNVAGQAPYSFTIPLTGNETIPADTNLTNGEQPQSEAITTAQLGAYNGSQPSKGNAIIGGDGSTNLFSLGTAGTSTTSATVAWKSANRWGQWSLSSAGVKIARDGTTADNPNGYLYGVELNHTNTTGGQICMGQWVQTVNSYQFQNQTAELDFHATTGAGYTGGTTLTAYIVTGTGTNEGLNKMAFTVNGGGATGWAGGVVQTAAVVPLSAVSTTGRFGAFVTVPSTATEIGVAFCYTAGTTDTNDYVNFDGIQLVRNPSQAALVSATVAYPSTSAQLTAFQRRLQAEETLYQQAYTYVLIETAAITPIAPCSAVDTTHTNCLLQFPTTMWTVPTMTYTAGFATPTSTTQATLGACTALATAATVTSATVNNQQVLINCTATTTPAAGVASFLYNDNASGVIIAQTEL